MCSNKPTTQVPALHQLGTRALCSPGDVSIAFISPKQTQLYGWVCALSPPLFLHAFWEKFLEKRKNTLSHYFHLDLSTWLTCDTTVFLWYLGIPNRWAWVEATACAHPSSLILSTNRRKQINKSIKYKKSHDQQINPTAIPNKYTAQKLMNRRFSLKMLTFMTETKYELSFWIGALTWKRGLFV